MIDARIRLAGAALGLALTLVSTIAEAQWVLLARRAIGRVDAVERPQIADDDARLKGVSEQYGQLLAERDFAAFIADLRQRYEVEVKLAPVQAQQ